MNILSQLLNIETKNLIINKTLSDIKYEITNFFESSINIFEGNFYLNFIIHLQKFMNEHIINIIHNIINYMDNEFKNSNDRKKTYYINKSNVERCIVTIFGELTFERTLYKNKFTGEYFFYIDEKLNLVKQVLAAFPGNERFVDEFCTKYKVNLN